MTEQLVQRARAEGIDLIRPGGLLTGLTKTVLEIVLAAAMPEHLGYDKHDPPAATPATAARPRRCPPRSRRSTSVSSDRDGSFEPVITRKRQPRLNGIDRIVLSLTARRPPARTARTSTRSAGEGQ